MGYLPGDSKVKMAKIGRPLKEQSQTHPLHGQLNGDVPWLDGCKEFSRTTCRDCPVPLDKCPAEHPRLHKGGRPAGIKNKGVSKQG
jgi:hypothetical protein